MTPFFKTLLKHPVSVIFYSAYTWLCYEVLRSRLEFHQWLKTHPQHSISYGEGIAYIAFFRVIVGAIFGLVTLINALVSKQVFFYAWLMAIVFIQTLVALNV
jgi:hypothetical protein